VRCACAIVDMSATSLALTPERLAATRRSVERCRHRVSVGFIAIVGGQQRSDHRIPRGRMAALGRRRHLAGVDACPGDQLVQLALNLLTGRGRSGRVGDRCGHRAPPRCAGTAPRHQGRPHTCPRRSPGRRPPPVPVLRELRVHGRAGTARFHRSAPTLAAGRGAAPPPPGGGGESWARDVARPRCWVTRTDLDTIADDKILSDCDRKLARYRAALEAGTDPTIVADWIRQVRAERYSGPWTAAHLPPRAEARCSLKHDRGTRPCAQSTCRNARERISLHGLGTHHDLRSGHVGGAPDVAGPATQVSCGSVNLS
jgi:hypothetical protein